MYAWTTQEEVSGATCSPHLFLDCLVLERRREKGEDQIYKSFVLDRYFVNTYFRVILVEGETRNPV